jgi:hypothetical protein
MFQFQFGIKVAYGFSGSMLKASYAEYAPWSHPSISQFPGVRRRYFGMKIYLKAVKYLKAVMVAERKGVAALRSVGDIGRKSTEDSIKSIAIYRRELDKVATRSSSGSS